MTKRYNRRRVKIHRNYTLAEAADLLGVHKHTVSRWAAAGLQTTDARRPLLIHGEDLRAFLRAREPIKQKCRPGEFYCLSCRAAKRPAFDIAQYTPTSTSRGLLSGFCPTCERPIYRAVSLATIEQKIGGLKVALPREQQRIDDSAAALLNADFNEAQEI
jgi:excisionase family DNA binding protein